METRDFSNNRNALVCLALAWPVTGLGFSVLFLDFIPTGVPLLVMLAGLCVAGAVSGAMLLCARGSLHTPVGKGWVTAAYAMFAPIGLMGGLLAPSPFESGTGSAVGLAIMGFLAIVVFASAAIGAGLAFTGGLAMAAHTVALRIHSSTAEQRT